MNTHREAIMAKRKQAHADNEGRITRSLMRRFKDMVARQDDASLWTAAMRKRAGLPHQGTREMARRAGHGRP